MKTDVVIVGAGPSGSAAALQLARSGLSVVLIERAQFPRRKVCGEYLNCGSIELLSALDIFEPLRRHLHVLRGVELAAGGRTLDLAFPKTAAGIARSVLDAMLLHAAKDAGATLISGGVTDVYYDAGRVCGVAVEGAEGKFRIDARFTIGADGCGSTIAKRLAFTQSVRTDARYAIGGHFTQTMSTDRLSMFVQNGSYLAINPISELAVNVMLVAPRAHFAQAKRQSDAWLVSKADELRAPYRRSTSMLDLDPMNRIGKRVSIGPLTHRVRKSTAPGLVLVGDAAGFISPFTGQGVFMALSSARAAALAISATCKQSSREGQIFADYESEQRKERNARSLLSTFLNVLGYLPPVARAVMARVEQQRATRDHLLAMFCGLGEPNAMRGAALLVPFLR